MGLNKSDTSSTEQAKAIERAERGAEVMALALSGLTYAAIGKQLGVSTSTARNDLIRSNRAALQERDELAEKMLAKMSADLQQNLNFCNAIVERVDGEIANIPRVSAQEKPKRDIAALEKRALLSIDRADRIIHRFASLTGMYPHDGRVGGVTIQGVASITIALPHGSPTERNHAVNGKVVALPEGDYHAE